MMQWRRKFDNIMITNYSYIAITLSDDFMFMLVFYQHLYLELGEK